MYVKIMKQRRQRGGVIFTLPALALGGLGGLIAKAALGSAAAAAGGHAVDAIARKIRGGGKHRIVGRKRKRRRRR